MTTRWSPASLAAAAGGLAVWLVIDAWRQAQIGIDSAGSWFLIAATGVALAAALAVGRLPDRRRMAMLILWWLVTAVAVDASGDWPKSSIAVTIWFLATGIQGPAYAHMALAYPSGRVRDRAEQVFVVVAYAAGVLWMAFPALFVSNAPDASSLIFTGTVIDLSVIIRVFWAIFIVLGVGFVLLVARRLLQSPSGARRTMLPLAAAAGFASAHFVALRIAWLINGGQDVAALDWLGRVDVLILPVAIWVGVETIRRDRGPVGDLVVELGTVGPQEVRAALARAVGDPSLELALWLPNRQQFVDEAGAPVEVDESAPGREVTLIGPRDQPLAALTHDASLAGQRPLLEAAGTAARLALENARLQAELHTQLAELRASRARIVAAGDAERRRLERDLHDGAQQRLLALGLALELLRGNQGDRDLLTEAQSELQAALHELRQLARGIHPAILTDRGLGPAVASLCDRAPLPVAAQVPDERYPPQVESAAYFVVSEALANVTKHASARSASVSIARQNGRLLIDVSDDGLGGAEPAAGSGLRGMEDRVGALDGSVSIQSEPGLGTSIHAEIPCAWS